MGSFSLLSFLAFITLIPRLVFAQDVVVAPFTTQGTLDTAVALSTKINAGGRITVNGWAITIPENLIVQFPNSYVPFQEFAAGSFIGDEVLVNGNVVGGVAIAAQVFISRNLANFGQGYIDTINYAEGTMKIVGGPTIRINDPNGVFSVGHTAAPPAYTADDESVSISSHSGFPMCIPRSSTDPLCPLSNRPVGLQEFNAPDPLVMVPFMPGDFIEFSGVPIGNELVVYAINCPSVMVTTTGTPAYVRVEDAVMGIYDGNALNEFGDSKYTGYVSDPSVTISMYAVDVDPCTGAVTERAVGSAFVKAGENRNKWEWRADTTTFTKYTREYKVKVSTGTTVTKNGIVAGQYIQPVTEWILPELLTVGVNPPPYDWTNFPQLTNGIYQDGFQFGPLSPWPGATAPPAPPACPVATPPAPTATAVPTSIPTIVVAPAQTVIPGSAVALRANLTNTDLTLNDVDFSWVQVSGPTVALFDNDTSTANFITPKAAGIVTRVFNATVIVKNSNSALVGFATTTVVTDSSIKDVVTIDSYTWTTRQSGTIAVVAHSNVIVDGSAKLQLFLGTSTTPVDMIDIGGGAFSYGARSTKKVVSITVKSALGGSASLAATTA